MAFNSNSQISYLVLNSLTNGSKYGLEIIESISKQTNGQYILKKPTLYSCLTRMEKKGWISSSYWSESELGGKRHYYSITSLGKQTLEELEKDFANISFTDFSSNLDEQETVSSETETDTEEKPVFLQQGNIFDMVKSEEKETEPTKTEQKSDILENQIDLFSFQENQNETTEDNSDVQEEQEPEYVDGGIFLTEHLNTEEQEKIDRYQSMLEQEQSPIVNEEMESVKEEILDDGKFLDEPRTLTPSQEEQNQRLYDTSSELKKYRKRKSFSENQIEMSVVYQKEEDDELERERIRQLKESLLSTRQTNQQQIKQEDTYNYSQETYTAPQSPSKVESVKEETEEQEHDDAIFITNPKLRDEEIPVQRKISPTNIEVNVYDDNLPAPKRDSSLEPTYKDMMSKLFERKKEKPPVTVKTAPQQNQVEIMQNNTESFTDYSTLKRYYSGHGIDFKEYKKTSVNINHNTNFLNLINSCLLLLLSGIGCAILFGIINGANLLISGTNFLFYTVPLIFLVYTIYTFVAYKVFPSKKATLKYNDWHIWVVFLLSVLIVFVINIACGMQVETMAKYLTSLLVPIYGLLIVLPINYYITKFIYKKFSK